MSFYGLKVSFEEVYYTFAEEPDKLFWGRLKENTFALLRERLEYLESREKLCVYRPKILTASIGPGYKTEGMDPVFVQTLTRSSVSVDKSTNKWS